ncbi:hypothetical protein BH24DEI2_BH24DEI2_16760 [soil metagenome]
MLLRAARALAPEDTEVEIYNRVDDLPNFNPDIEFDALEAVADLKAKVDSADGLILSSPEYAHGVPGSFKNALDWLVGGPEFYEKPVIFFNVVDRATYAQASLREVVKTMSGKIIEEACCDFPPLIKQMNVDTFQTHPELSKQLKATLVTFAAALSRDSS